MTALLDTHVIHWWSTNPDMLSRAAVQALSEADELVVAGISWYELAWLVRRQRITITMPIPAWLEELSSRVRTLGITPAIAAAAALLPASFRNDPVDRLIYATAVEHGLQLVTKDERMLRQPHSIAVW
ncbi:MAG TPA: type II toxin-antitoxin system VapC family toxin [Chloroflexota bacterium]|nr:type II toxin-antitoxin system VapC family toxin [Chloroflexota bacterium]